MASRPPRITSTRRQPTTRAPLTPGQQSVRTLRAWYRNPRRNVGTKPKPAAPPAAPAAPVVPAAPAYSLSALPPDASYDAALATLARQRDDQLTALTQARTSNLSDYGFKEGPNGALAFDPNNPYSKAALLKKAYDTNRRSTGQSMASGGQLYSGAFQNAQDLVNRNQAQGEDSLQKSLIGFLARNTQGAVQARTGYETAAGQAYGDRLSRFQSNPLYDPASGALMPADATGGGSVPLAGPIGGRSITVPPRQEKTVRGKRYYKGKSGRWIPV
jgi:hypothetical protein